MIKAAVVFALTSAALLHAQLGQTTDWYALGGDSQHDGWEKNEQKFVKDDVKDFRLLWQRKLYSTKLGVGALQPPVILGNLIGYRGFKELAFVAGSTNSLWSMDSDLDRMYWEKHFTPEKAHPKKSCLEDLTASPALPAPVVFRAPAKPATPAAAPTFAPASPPRPANAAARSYARPHPIFLLTGDGMLRSLNQSDGSDMVAPIPFVPAGTQAQSLNVFEDTVFTSTRDHCGKTPAVWSLDTATPNAPVKSFALGSNVAGLGGIAIDTDGKLFVQTQYGAFDPNSGKYGGALLALNRDLTLDHYFLSPQEATRRRKISDQNYVGPTVFTYKNQELVASSSAGRIYLLKASEVGGEDHNKYVSRTSIISAITNDKAQGIWGNLSSWEDTDATRYVLAPVWGPLSGELKALLPNSNAPHGSIVAFKLEEKDGVPILTPAWVSRDLESPMPPVIARGTIFALSSGTFDGNKPVKDTHATLYALDGATGQEIYSTGDKVTAAGNLTGISIANGRVYFITVDNMLNVFGKYLEH